MREPLEVAGLSLSHAFVRVVLDTDARIPFKVKWPEELPLLIFLEALSPLEQALGGQPCCRPAASQLKGWPDVT